MVIDEQRSFGRRRRQRRPVTMWDVAKRADVSQSTVSFVINETPNVRAAPATRERVFGLGRIAQRNFLLHSTQAGSRLIRMDSLSPVAANLRGATAQSEAHAGRGCAIGVWVTAGRAPTHGDVHFSYNMEYRANGVLGRHKLHAVPPRGDPRMASPAPSA